jgi:Uma2 family endonuclease
MAPIHQLDRSTRRRRAPAKLPPPLENGDHLVRAEFERRYEAMPPNVRAELVDGVVHVSSPTKVLHADYHAPVVGWLYHYAVATPGCHVSVDGTLRIGGELDEPQPDAVLRVETEAGGLSRVDEDGYLAGPVELAAEMAASSASYDLHEKKTMYLRHGVREYLVVLAYTSEVRWFERDESGYALLPEKDGVLRSRVFPGLWLDVRALLEGDGARLLAVLDRGLASKAHAAFVRELAKKLGRGRRRRRP